MARELKPLTDTEGNYIDDNTVVGYDYINQEYYVNKLNSMSFSRFVYPENSDEVLDAITKYFNE